MMPMPIPVPVWHSLLMAMIVTATTMMPINGSLNDETELYACHDESVTLRCDNRGVDSTLVIYRAVFSTDGAFSSKRPECSHEPVSLNETCSDDVRLVVNSKCSGMTTCEFLVSDLVPRECYGDGMFRLAYGCAPVGNVIKFCNVNVNGSTAEGFIQNPGYPNFYPDLSRCTWTIRANQGQHVLVSLLDMSMQRTAGTAADCRDYLQIYDGSVKVMHSCGQDVDLLHTFVSVTNVVYIVFTSHDVWPSRGVFLYYRVLGCPTLPVPLHGYLVYRNTTMAHYMCCARHVFVDNYLRNRLLYCQDGNRWNGTVVSCHSIGVLRQWKNLSGVTFDEETDGAVDAVSRFSIQPINISVDILIPAIIMVAMVISNVIIVLVILRMRKRREKDDDMDELNGNQYKEESEPQPSTSKEHGLDTVEPSVTRV